MVFANKALRRRLVRPKLSIGNDIISYAPSYKYLGVTLDPMLNFNHHIPTVTHSVRHKVFMFNYVKHDLPQEPALKVVKTMVIPIIDYCDVFYDVASKTNLENIQKLVNRSLRITYRRTGILNTAALHRKAKLNKLKDRRHMHILELAFKKSLINSELDIINIATRRRDQRLLLQKRAKNPAYVRSLKYRLASAWNSLHVEQRAINDIDRFNAWNKGHHFDLIKNYV